MSWKISFYSRKVEREALGLPDDVLADTLRILELIEEYGPFIGNSYTVFVGRGWHEIRTGGKAGLGRLVFCTVGDREIVVLHSFVRRVKLSVDRNMAPINTGEVG